MKRRWKIFWITCGAVAAIGAAFCIAALALGVTPEAILARFPSRIGIVKHYDDVYDDHEYPYDDDHYVSGDESYVGESDVGETLTGIRKIDAEIWAGDLQILRSETGDFKIETEDVSPNLKFHYYVEDGELKITTDKAYFRLNKGWNDGVIYLFVPEGSSLEEVNFKHGAGTIYIEDISAGSLDLEVGAGEAVIDHFQADEVEMNCGAGSITASGNGGRELDIECGIGEIDLTVSGVKEDYSYAVECGIGEVEIDGETFSSLGSEKHIENHTQKEMNIDCGIGTVRVNFDGSL